MNVKSVLWCKDKVSIPGIALYDYESERAFQVYCADYLRKRYEQTKERKYQYWHHSANERENARESFYAKMMSQQKGFPDLINCERRIVIELKVKGRKASKKQKEVLQYFKDIKWQAEIIRSFERFRDLVES